MLKPKYFRPEWIDCLATPKVLLMWSISFWWPSVHNNMDFTLFIIILEASWNLQKMWCSAVHCNLERIPKIRMSSTKKLCNLYAMSQGESGTKILHYGSFDIWQRPSMTNINSRGDNEQSRRSALHAPKILVGYPFIITTYWIVHTQAIIHSIFFISNPILKRMLRRKATVVRSL